MFFCESWGFKYNRETDDSFVISKNLSVNRGKEFEYLKKYYGLDIKDYESDTDVIPFIVNEIKNDSPVILMIDSFWCPWKFRNYHKQHSLHYIIVNGFDEEKGVFYCLDNQYAVNGGEITKEDLENAC